MIYCPHCWSRSVHPRPGRLNRVARWIEASARLLGVWLSLSEFRCQRCFRLFHPTRPPA